MATTVCAVRTVLFHVLTCKPLSLKGSSFCKVDSLDAYI